MAQTPSKFTLKPPEAKPFLKWAGGKRGLIRQYEPFFPREFRRYFEPFLGSGAVFFHLRPGWAHLSDGLEELINCYLAVRDEVEGLIALLRAHIFEREYYYRLRALKPEALSPIERASRFLYLNRTCYNGLYRVNSRGRFNVPIGSYKNPTICDAENLRAAGAALKGVELIFAPFSHVLELAGAGDFIYLDPPYFPLSPTSNFTGYTPESFGEPEQRELSRVFRGLDRRGALLMLSNSDHPLTRELYRSFRVREIQAPRAINRKAEGRGYVGELLVTNY